MRRRACMAMVSFRSPNDSQYAWRGSNGSSSPLWVGWALKLTFTVSFKFLASHHQPTHPLNLVVFLDKYICLRCAYFYQSYLQEGQITRKQHFQFFATCCFRPMRGIFNTDLPSYKFVSSPFSHSKYSQWFQTVSAQHFKWITHLVEPFVNQSLF